MCLCVAVSLHPGFVLSRDEGGVSDYGVHAATVVPYTLALAIGAACSFGAAHLLRATRHVAHRLARTLDVYAVLLVLALVSTYGYTLDHTLRQVHLVVGLVGVAFETLTGVAFARALPQRMVGTAWATALLIGVALAVVDLVRLAHVLFLAQAIVTVSYAALVILVTGHVERAARAAPTT